MNQSTAAPVFVPVADYDAVFDPPLRAIDVTADGTLTVEDIVGEQAIYILANVAPVYRLVAQIRKVVGDGVGGVGDGVTETDIPLASLQGLR